MCLICVEHIHFPRELPLQVWDDLKGSVSCNEQRCPTWKENYRGWAKRWALGCVSTTSFRLLTVKQESMLPNARL